MDYVPIKPGLPQTDTSTMYRPNERNFSEEAKICLNCDLDFKNCKLNNCKRYKRELSKIMKGVQ